MCHRKCSIGEPEAKGTLTVGSEEAEKRSQSAIALGTEEWDAQWSPPIEL